MIKKLILVILSLVALLFLSGLALAEPPRNVLTYHNDTARTGWNPFETILTPAKVAGGQFGFLFADKVDGQVYGQPLYVSHLNLPDKGFPNVLFVVTEHDSVYALDADHAGKIFWQDHFTGISNGVTISTVSEEDVNGCDQITPEIGITDTPVIDLATQTIYLVAMTKEISAGPVTNFVHRLHTLDLATGSEKPGSPVVIQASVPQTKSGDIFNPISYKERCGLVLSNGVVYTTWASHCDFNHWGTYHGWLIGYDAQTLQQKYVFNSTPNGSEASFWASGVAPALDENGRLFLMTGNGTYDGLANQDWGDSFIRLEANGQNDLQVTDSFTPSNQANLSDNDQDLGSGGALLLPEEVGSLLHPHLLVGAGKDGVVYLVDRDNMGGFRNINLNVQAVTLTGREFGIPAYFNHNLYFGFSEGKLSQVGISNGVLSLIRSVDPTLGFPGAVPSVSSNGTSHGILWVAVGTSKNPTLRAYNANSLKLLYESKVRSVTKFAVPTVVNGKVYLGGSGFVQVFGLKPGL